MTQAVFSIQELEQRLSNLLENQDDVAKALHWILFRYQRCEDLQILNFHGSGNNGKTEFLSWLNKIYGIEIACFSGEDEVPRTGIVMVDGTSSQGLGVLMSLQGQGVRTLFLTFGNEAYQHSCILNLKCKEKDLKRVMLSQ